MNRKHIAYLFVAASAATLFGCGGNGEDPLAPSLSATIVDRMGRAAVNTALTDPFNTNTVAANAVKDDYNSASNPSLWDALFTTMIADNLAIFDGLDRNCGNQLLAGAAPAAPGRYDVLGSVLAEDQLYVNAASGLCSQYLAVEANAAGIANTDCGGRTPLYDAIDTTYSVLVVGALTGVTDGVGADSDGTASLDTFPFLDNPN